MFAQEWIRKQSLGQQLIISFIGSSLAICFVLIFITNYQLNWLSDQIGSNTKDILNIQAMDQIQALTIVEGNYAASELTNFVLVTATLKNFAEIIHNFTSQYSKNPFVLGTLYSSIDFSGKTYEYGTYYSKNTISDAGYRLLKQESCFNSIYSLIYYSELLGYYEGYITDELFHFYPGTSLTAGYNPLTREWFYRGENNKTEFIITEPYIDYGTGDYVISVSRAIQDLQNSVYGVTAVDVTLAILTEKLSKFLILGHGFVLLISQGGIIINPPATWDTIGSAVIKIYDEVLTGISLEQWNEIKSLLNGQTFAFTSSKGIDYNVSVHQIRPFPDSDEVTHYLFLCAETTELLIGKAFADRVIKTTYSNLFTTVMIIGIVVFSLISVLITIVTRSYARKLKAIENVFKSILHRACIVNVTKEADFSSIEGNVEGIENLVMCTRLMVEELRVKEMVKFKAKEGETRPTDVMLFDEWRQKLYPMNFYCDEMFEWRVLLQELEN